MSDSLLAQELCETRQKLERAEAEVARLWTPKGKPAPEGKEAGK